MYSLESGCACEICVFYGTWYVIDTPNSVFVCELEIVCVGHRAFLCDETNFVFILVLCLLLIAHPYNIVNRSLFAFDYRQPNNICNDYIHVFMTIILFKNRF